MPKNDKQRLRRVLTQRLESLEQAGVLEIPKGRANRCAKPATETAKSTLAASIAKSEGAAKTSSRTAPPSTPQSPTVKEPARKVAKSAGWTTSDGGQLFVTADAPPREISTAPTLEILQQEVAPCTLCSELATTRTQTVFGVGNPQARLCFLGEAPGADEDRLGEPFVGRAGQLLNKIIEACKMRRDDIYICNILKCRPPGNRNPLPAEAANCRRFLDRQLELIAPEFICCLGSVAAQNLLGTQITIGKFRGKMHTYRGAQVVCTYHPAYLLRNPDAKKDTWEDMKFLMRAMGMEVS